MLKGKSLVELAQAVQATAERKMDVVADTRDMAFDVQEAVRQIGEKTEKVHTPRLAVRDIQVQLTPHALGQLTTHASIPAKYADRMLRDAPALLSQNMNHWLQSEPSTRMVRMLRGEPNVTGRAVVSNRYHRMENESVLGAVLPEIHGVDDIRIMSCELTESRLYLKVVFPSFDGAVKVGDIVQYGWILSNSEIGMGALNLAPFIYRLRCTNGMTGLHMIDESRLRKTHLGRALEEGIEYFSDETLKADDTALQLKLRDTLRAFRDPARWAAVLARLQAAANTVNAVDPVTTIERVAEMLVLPKPEQNAVLTNFIRDGDLSQWGLANAVTAVANESESYDRACELEHAGGRIISLNDSDWSRLAKAA